MRIRELSANEIATFQANLAKRGPVEAPSEPEESPIDELAGGIVRGVVNNAALAANGFRGEDTPEPTEASVGEYGIEELLFYLHMVDRLAFLDSDVDRRIAFMDALVGSVAHLLWENYASGVDMPRFVEYFIGMYNVRQQEYAGYHAVTFRRGQSSKNTLLWEYGKRMTAIIATDKSATRVLLIGNIAMKYVSGLVPLVRKVAKEL
jgi:hypothetical protein